MHQERLIPHTQITLCLTQEKYVEQVLQMTKLRGLRIIFLVIEIICTALKRGTDKRHRAVKIYIISQSREC